MTTVRELIDRTRHHVMTSMPDRLNILTGAISDTDTTITLTYELLGVADGSRLTIDLEELHVITTSGTTPGSTATVIRGYDGSTAAAHDAGSIVRVNPQFSDFKILKSVNECVSGLAGDGLFRIKPFTFDFNPSQAGYEITAADFLDVWKVTYDTPGPLNNWPEIPRQYFDIDLAADTTDFPSGKAIFLRVPGASGFPIKVSYRAGFATSLDPTANVESVMGLPTSSTDIPPLGAAIRLNFGRDIKRSFLTRQPEPRRQEEVPPNSAQQSIQTLMRWYYQAIDREKKLLYRQYPTRL